MIQLYLNGNPDLSRFDAMEWNNPELKAKARKLQFPIGHSTKPKEK